MFPIVDFERIIEQCANKVEVIQKMHDLMDKLQEYWKLIRRKQPIERRNVYIYDMLQFLASNKHLVYLNVSVTPDLGKLLERQLSELHHYKDINQRFVSTLIGQLRFKH
jgi:hypothetical protein|tara:strand:- start:8010 stop:8336 length:327 start_codon:yes stop_codon:yes gene_type:complete